MNLGSCWDIGFKGYDSTEKIAEAIREIRGGEIRGGTSKSESSTESTSSTWHKEERRRVWESARDESPGDVARVLYHVMTGAWRKGVIQMNQNQKDSSTIVAVTVGDSESDIKSTGTLAVSESRSSSTGVSKVTSICFWVGTMVFLGILGRNIWERADETDKTRETSGWKFNKRNSMRGNDV